MTPAMPRILIDRTRCIGAGQCVANAVDHFTQSAEDGLSVALAPATTAGGQAYEGLQASQLYVVRAR